MDRFSPSDVLRRFDRVLWIAPVAFFLTASAWSVLDAEFSTDTWMGLAAGRQLLEQLDWCRFYETFPTSDTFSYTFYQQAWFNGNWLSNLGQYWIFDRIGPSAVVYVTWAIAACVQGFVVLAVYWRTESWLAGWLAAAVVGIGGRDFLEPRAAIVGLLCLAALWSLICAIEGQRDRRRWWPIALLPPLLVLWSAAHGGFVFGYGLLALYVGHWLAVRLCRTHGGSTLTLILPVLAIAYLASSGANLLLFDKPALMRWLPVPAYVAYWSGIRFGKSDTAATGQQILSIAAVLIAAIVIAMMLSPFGIESFTHFGKIASGAIYRTVSSEWYPAYSNIGGAAPPMWRFWKILGLTGSGVLLLWLAGKIAPRFSTQGAPDRSAAPWSLFDAALVLICVCMTLWARRFAPLLYVLSAPVLAIWVMRLADPLVPHLRGYGIPGLKLGAALAAVVTGWLTWTTAQRDLIDAFKHQPATGILERARGQQHLDQAVRFVGENLIRVNILTDYGDGASVMFYAPLARVFTDARADQLYTEQHYRKYLALMDSRTPANEVRRSLDETDTDAVLVPSWGGVSPLQHTLLFSPDWALVFLNARYTLFLRRGSPPLNRLGELVREGQVQWPNSIATASPYVQVSRALMLLNTRSSTTEQALDLLKGTVDRQPPLGQMLYPTIVRALAETTAKAAATEYVLLQATRLVSDTTMHPSTRTALLASLAESRVQLERPGRDTVELPSDSPNPLVR